MKKIFLIGWKDVTLAFRDRAALILMLLAPFLLTLGLGFVTGRLSGSGGSSGVSDIPLVIVNQDSGTLGRALVEMFQSKDLDDLVNPVTGDDPAAARLQVDEDKVAAAIIVPAGFSASVIPESGASAAPALKIELYSNPSRPTSSGIIKSIMDGFIARMEAARAGAQVTILELISHGLLAPQDAARVGGELGARQAKAAGAPSALSVRSVTTSGEAVQFDILAYMAPGMALMFLMFTASQGGRTLLVERNHGTLPRLLVSPTTTGQVLAGKVVGTFLTGVAQLLILIGASTLLFRINWGDPLAVLALVLAAAFGATGWGMLIAALVKTPGQVGSLGSAVMLIFGMLGGSFFSLSSFPAWFQALAKITPNAWGMDGFTILASGGRLGQITGVLAGLGVMGLVLFGISMALFNRRSIMQR